MSAKVIQALLRRIATFSAKRKTTGFTLIELIVTIIIAGFVITALLSFLVEMVQSDRREYARSETQREMQMALDYMVADLREAAYVYDDNELMGTKENRGPNKDVPPIKDFLTIPNGYVPILAFWKPETVPYQDSKDTLPSCDGMSEDKKPECELLTVKRRAYTLVVYFQAENKGDDKKKWKGQSRILRYQLRKYRTGRLNNLEKFTGYVEPAQPGINFEIWPYRDKGGGTISSDQTSKPQLSEASPQVLVDFVDDPKRTEFNGKALNIPGCPPWPKPDPTPSNPNYRRTPSQADKNTSFYVCVKSHDATVGASGANQDVFIFIRGNPTGKAGIKAAPLLTVRTQAVARGVIDKRPD